MRSAHIIQNHQKRRRTYITPVVLHHFNPNILTAVLNVMKKIGILSHRRPMWECQKLQIHLCLLQAKLVIALKWEDIQSLNSSQWIKEFGIRKI